MSEINFKEGEKAILRRKIQSSFTNDRKKRYDWLSQYEPALGKEVTVLINFCDGIVIIHHPETGSFGTSINALEPLLKHGTSQQHSNY